MKAFLAALVTLSLLVGGVILATVAGTEKLDEYLNALPSEGAKLPEAARVLGELGDRVEEEDRLLLCSLYHHEKIDTLASAVRRAEAAAEAEDDAEYRILRGELESLIEDMKRDLHLHLGDIV
jgi:hypothetical protein